MRSPPPPRFLATRNIYCRRRPSPHCQDLLSQCTSEYVYQISPRAFLCLCTHFISLLLRLIESPPCLFFRYKTTFTDFKPALSSMLCGPVPVSPVSSPGASSPCTLTQARLPALLACHSSRVRSNHRRRVRKKRRLEKEGFSAICLGFWVAFFYTVHIMGLPYTFRISVCCKARVNSASFSHALSSVYRLFSRLVTLSKMWLPWKYCTAYEGRASTHPSRDGINRG